MRENVQGVIYLLHFEKPFKHARHYLGWTEGDSVQARLDRHRAGNGSKLVAAVVKAGIDFKVARLWHGTRHDERALKKSKNVPKFCLICREETQVKEIDLRKPEDCRVYCNNFVIPGKGKLGFVELADGRRVDFHNMSDEDAVMIAHQLYQMEVDGCLQQKKRIIDEGGYVQ